MTVTYLSTQIEESKQTPVPRWGMTADGYTLRSGAPTSLLIRLKGEKRWRRLMVWCFSNANTVFVRINGKPQIVDELSLPLQKLQ